MSRFDRRLSGTPALHGAHGKPKGTPCSVQQALGWAFGLEKAQREFPEPRDAERTLCYGFGLKYVRMQRAALGCKVDGGQFKGGSYTHPDAG
jgi:hypothetical protein